MNNRVWFISDLHLGHEAILTFEPFLRPFKTIEEHDQAIFDFWTLTVRPNDTVWILGDLALGGAKKMLAIQGLGKLPGKKKLVLGNHDPDANEIAKLGVFHTIHGAYVLQNKSWLLTHIPVHPNCLGSRFAANIHGHTHSKRVNDPRYLCVSCEQTGMKPISKDEVIARLAQQKKEYEVGQKSTNGKGY